MGALRPLVVWCPRVLHDLHTCHCLLLILGSPGTEPHDEQVPPVFQNGTIVKSLISKTTKYYLNIQTGLNVFRLEIINCLS